MYKLQRDETSNKGLLEYFMAFSLPRRKRSIDVLEVSEADYAQVTYQHLDHYLVFPVANCFVQTLASAIYNDGATYIKQLDDLLGRPSHFTFVRH